ncbi:MAG: DNA sulfur modification protein DndB, partial [Actinomycetota bacterium]|nr:DNA sulfur modification protein DndB [Actinomycetota bacterium]
ALLNGIENSVDDRADTAQRFWEAVAPQFPEWEAVRASRLSAGEVRQDFIHSHGIVLHALGIAGRDLVPARPDSWTQDLERLREIDWRRSNTALWEGRALLGGRVSKARQNLVLTTNTIKIQLQLPLGPDERRVEEAYAQGRSA